jgi:hypothetical protein
MLRLQILFKHPAAQEDVQSARQTTQTLAYHLAVQLNTSRVTYARTADQVAKCLAVCETINHVISAMTVSVQIAQPLKQAAHIASKTLIWSRAPSVCVTKATFGMKRRKYANLA